MSIKKRYVIEVKESGKPPKIIEVETLDLDKYLEDYSRNKHIEKYEILEEEYIKNKNLLLG